MVSVEEVKGKQIAEETWEAVRAILKKYNRDIGTDSKAVGLAIVVTKADGNVHVSIRGQMTPCVVVEALIETFENIAAEEKKGQVIPVE